MEEERKKIETSIGELFIESFMNRETLAVTDESGHCLQVIETKEPLDLDEEEDLQKAIDLVEQEMGFRPQGTGNRNLLPVLNELYKSFPIEAIHDFDGPAPKGDEKPNYEAIEDFLKTEHKLSNKQLEEIKATILNLKQLYLTN